MSMRKRKKIREIRDFFRRVFPGNGLRKKLSPGPPGYRAG